MQVTFAQVGHRFARAPWLFRWLSGSLETGNSYALTGPSGSGKSTLLSILAGWESPTTGRVTFAGIEKIGWVFQNPHGVAKRSVIDHVMLPILALGNSLSEAEVQARQLLCTFGLSHLASQRFCTLSGGEAQRLMLARGIASAPDLLLIDEPTAQLDVRTSHEVNKAIGKLAGKDRIVVVATHDEETRDACDDVIDLRNFQGADNHRELLGSSTSDDNNGEVRP